MHTVRYDVEKNMLYVTLIGILKIHEVKQIKEEMFSSIEKLSPNFDVINDLSRLIHSDDNTVPIGQEILKFEIEKKVNRIVRVIGQSKYGLIQFAKYTKQEEAKHTKYVPTLEEAEEYLSNSHEESST
jgi:hypothetical protein